MNELERYYNKFNEEKRLDSRHGQVEYRVAMTYIRRTLEAFENAAEQENSAEESEEAVRKGIRILDVGAGTGRYAIPLSEEGYSVTAVEPVRHNLGRLKQKGPKVTAYEGDARKLKRFADGQFHLVILFGPMYHLKSREDRLQALLEAKRVLRPDGRIFISYISNEYSVITYAFKGGHIREAMEKGMLDENFHCTDRANPLYDYARPEDIYSLSEEAGLIRERILSPDGAADYMRPELNAMDPEEFDWFVKYQLSVCERPELLGAGSHILDILRKEEI